MDGVVFETLTLKPPASIGAASSTRWPVLPSNEDHTIVDYLIHPDGDLEHQPRFADATRTGERQ